MPDGMTSNVDYLAQKLARKHYEHLCRHEGDPLDLPWMDLPEAQRNLWAASMADLISSLTLTEVHALMREIQPQDSQTGVPEGVRPN